MSSPILRLLGQTSAKPNLKTWIRDLASIALHPTPVYRADRRGKTSPGDTRAYAKVDFRDVEAAEFEAALRETVDEMELEAAIYDSAYEVELEKTIRENLNER